MNALCLAATVTLRLPAWHLCWHVQKTRRRAQINCEDGHELVTILTHANRATDRQARSHPSEPSGSPEPPPAADANFAQLGSQVDSIPKISSDSLLTQLHVQL